PIKVKKYEYMATGRSNVWICEMGSKDENGSFEEFIVAFEKATFEGDTYGIRYESPSLGTITTGWSKPLTVGGEEIRTDYQMRYDNPWCECKRADLKLEISDGKSSLNLDFTKANRKLI
ncbi:MAG: hypothetical protein KAH14_01510, partial [Clostridiales bacterium]|nr:hypothetical protein [Clostridiales bacterium]